MVVLRGTGGWGGPYGGNTSRSDGSAAAFPYSLSRTLNPEGGGSIVQNEPLHLLADSHRPPFGSVLRRGYIKQAQNIPGEKFFRFNFLFNPETIRVAVSASDTYSILDDVDPIKGTFGQTQVSFSLLIDRVFDVADPNSYIREEGCYHDIKVLQQLTRVLRADPADPSQNVYLGVMTKVPARIYFGPDYLQMFGWLETFDYEYVRFNEKMIPTRAAVNISFSQSPPNFLTNLNPDPYIQPTQATSSGGSGVRSTETTR